MAGELLLVGSIPCETAEQTFRIFAPVLGRWLSWMPDGEVGNRRYWIDGIAYRVFNGHPDLETVHRPAPDADGVEQWRPTGPADQFKFRVRPGVSKVRFGDPGWRLGFARDAANSYAIFRLLKQTGVVPKHIRFQVCIPATYSALGRFFTDEDTPKLVPGYTEALTAEIARIVELVPNDDLAIQLDLAVEQGFVQSAAARSGSEGRAEAARVTEPLAQACAAVPPAVVLGHHICFGTLGGWPLRHPDDLAAGVLLANAAVKNSGRHVDYTHLPTLGSAAEDFFRPLSNLEIGDTFVYMGTIHHLHGKGGMEAQLRTIKTLLPKFGIAAPCGFGRAPEGPGRLLNETGERIPDYLDVILRDHKTAMAAYEKVMG